MFAIHTLYLVMIFTLLCRAGLSVNFFLLIPWNQSAAGNVIQIKKGKPQLYIILTDIKDQAQRNCTSASVIKMSASEPHSFPDKTCASCLFLNECLRKFKSLMMFLLPWKPIHFKIFWEFFFFTLFQKEMNWFTDEKWKGKWNKNM